MSSSALTAFVMWPSPLALPFMVFVMADADKGSEAYQKELLGKNIRV